MRNDEPETKHLCVAELREYLAQARLKDVERSPMTATRISLDPQAIGRPTRGNLTGPGAAPPRASRPDEIGEPRAKEACSDDARTWIFHRKDLVSARSGRLRYWSVRVVPVGLACGLLACLLHPPFVKPQEAELRPAPSLMPKAKVDVVIEELPQQRVVEDTGSEVSPSAAPIHVRQAVDLLLSGDSRAALDAYRRLHEQVGTSSEFALAVDLLERELARCADPNTRDKASCAR